MIKLIELTKILLVNVNKVLSKKFNLDFALVSIIKNLFLVHTYF